MKSVHRETCEGCFYYDRLTSRGSFGIRICSYILKTGKPRGCSPEDCDKYTKNKKQEDLMDHQYKFCEFNRKRDCKILTEMLCKTKGKCSFFKANLLDELEVSKNGNQKDG